MNNIWTKSINPGDYVQLDTEDLYIAQALQQFERTHGYKRSDYVITKVDRIKNGFILFIRPYGEITDFTITIEVE